MIPSKIHLPGVVLFMTTLLAIPAQADVSGNDSPLFLTWAERALEAGEAERAIDVVSPRLHELRAAGERNRGYAVLCKAYLETREHEVAETACASAAGMSVADWTDFNNHGVLRYRIGDYEAAAWLFERAVVLNPESDSVRRNLAAAQRSIAAAVPGNSIH